MNRTDPNVQGWITALIITALVVAVVAADHYLAKNHPKGKAVRSNKKKNGFNEDFLYARGGGPKADNNEVTFVDFEAGIYDGTMKTENYSASLTQIGQIEATATFDRSFIPDVEVSALVSAYTMDGEYSFELFGVDISICGALYVGYIGAGIDFDPIEWEFGITTPTAGIGGAFKIDFDF